MTNTKHALEKIVGAGELPDLWTDRLVLRWLTERDVPDLFAIFGDPAVCRFWSHAALADAAAAAALQKEIEHLFREATLFQWGIALQSTDRVIGTCTLAGITTEHRRAEIGFALRQDEWGKGYLREALAAVLHFSFESLVLHRIEADVDPRNDRSIRVLEHAGFTREGYMRQRYFIDGEAQDAVSFGLLSTDL